MPFKYSCFISYRVGKEELTTTFIQELKEALNAYIEPYSDREVFIDHERIQGGDFYEKSLATALCESLCMVLVFTPKYFDIEKTFCTREYMAMELLEKRRLEAIREKCGDSSGFIIPIVFRGQLPREIKENRHFYDFSRYTLIDAEIKKHKEYTQYITQIAKRIATLSQCFDGLDKEDFLCKNIDLPTEQEAKNWLKTLNAPQSEFPGP